MIHQFRKHQKDLIGQGQMIAAFQQLRTGLAEDSEYSKLVLTRLCQFQTVKKQFIGGLITEQEYQTEQSRTARVLLELLDDISEADLNPDILNPVNAYLRSLPIGRMGKLHLVNCDRQEPFLSFASFFKDHGSLPFQFYFIAGQPAQKPSSFAERIIYEIIEDKEAETGDVVVEYEREVVVLSDDETRMERLKFQPLPLGLDAISSQLKFKKYFSERIGPYHRGVTLDTFFETRDKCLQFSYIALVFQLEADRWDAEVGRYVHWIMDTFRGSPEGQPRFLVFFVIHQSQKRSDRFLSNVREMVARAPDCCLVVEDLEPVNREAVCTWFRGVSSVPDQSKFETVIDGFGQELQQKQRWNGKTDFDMCDVESLLERVYLNWLKHKT